MMVSSNDSGRVARPRTSHPTPDPTVTLSNEHANPGSALCFWPRLDGTDDFTPDDSKVRASFGP